MNTSNYLNVPLSQLFFIFPLYNLNDAEISANGELVLRRYSELEDGLVNVTRGRLNALPAIQPDAQEPILVMANIVDLAKANPLFSIAPADTYFWNKDQNFTVPKAILFTTSKNLLPQAVLSSKAVQVIVAEKDTDKESGLHKSLRGYCKKHKIPVMEIKGSTWADLPEGLDSEVTEDLSRQAVQNAIGYHVHTAPYINSPYIVMERVATGLYRLKAELGVCLNVEDFESGLNNKKVSGNYGFVYHLNRLDLDYERALCELPLPQREFYQNRLGTQIRKLVENLKSKIELWYPKDPIYYSLKDSAAAQLTLEGYAASYLAGESLENLSQLVIEQKNLLQALLVDLRHAFQDVQTALWAHDLDTTIGIELLLNKCRFDSSYSVHLSDTAFNHQVNVLKGLFQDYTFTLMEHLSLVHCEIRGLIEQQSLSFEGGDFYQNIRSMCQYLHHQYTTFSSLNKNKSRIDDTYQDLMQCIENITRIKGIASPLQVIESVE